MINTQLISRPEKVCIFMINKTHNGQFSVKLNLVVFIRIALSRNNKKYPIFIIEYAAISVNCPTVGICAQGFFLQFWEGALGPFRLGKLAR